MISISFWSGSEINTDLQADPDATTESKELWNKTTELPALFDNIFILILILLYVGVIIASFLIDTHPIWFVITVILFIFVLFIAMVLGNSYEELMNDDDFSSQILLYPKMHWIMTHYLTVALVFGFTIMIVLFAKPKG